MRKTLIVFLLLACVQASFGQLSGPLSGTLGPGIYTVVGDISVDSGNTLTLLPGTTFNFLGPYSFRINGILLAEGTESDSIVFTTNQSDTNRWRGLRIYDSTSSSSRLSYCLIEYGLALGDFPDGRGGGVFCSDSSSPSFTNCTFRSNRSTMGGGIYCYYSSPNFTSCAFIGNTAQSDGGGARCYGSSPSFTNCTFCGNSSEVSGGGVGCSYSSPVLTNCTISSNSADVWGGGMRCWYSSPTFDNCTLSGNSCLQDGGGLSCYYSSASLSSCRFSGNSASRFGGGVDFYQSSPILANCTFSGNYATQFGGGLSSQFSSSPHFADCIISSNWTSWIGGGVACVAYSSPSFLNCTIGCNTASYSIYHRGVGGGVYCLDNSSPVFTNCTITNNSTDFYGGGVYCTAYSSPRFMNCTMSGNSATQCGGGVFCGGSSPIFNSVTIAFSIGSGVYFDSSAQSQVEYCDIFDNSGGDIQFQNNDPSQGPPGIGVITTTNANGDPADAYMNIFLNPLFMDTAVADFHLGDYSPCIGAADPTNPWPTDFEGDPRPNPPGSFPDIGIDEHWRDVPLPVELTTFQAITGDGQVILRWRTESELDNDHFVLYKRKAGEENFRILAQISGHGTTTEPHDYEYVDRFVRNGITYEYRISDVDITGREAIHEQIVSATPQAAMIPTEFALHAPYPNPFNPVTTIRYDVKEVGLVSLKIFDLLGREVVTLVHDIAPPGSYSASWDASGLASGVYLCRMEARGFVQTRKVVLLK